MSEEQWQNVLLASLLHHRLPLQDVDKLEVVANLAGNVLAINFRNNISGITQKLGEIIFKQDDEQELNITSWCETAVQRSTDLEAELQGLSGKYEEQRTTIEKLNQQLDDLIKAKKTHEDTMLQKFSELLNSKKMKIRDQQRLLASAKVDPQQVAKVEKAQEKLKPHIPDTSSTRKRKANGAALASQSSEDESFERKAPTQRDQSDDSGSVNTPKASDQDATEDESDDDLDSAPQASTLLDPDKVGEARNAREGNMQLDTPPPTRVLPFDKGSDDRGQRTTKQPENEDQSLLNQEAGNEDEETDEDDDDEL